MEGGPTIQWPNEKKKTTIYKTLHRKLKLNISNIVQNTSHSINDKSTSYFNIVGFFRFALELKTIVGTYPLMKQFLLCFTMCSI
jgi:hypothetical protein